MVLDRKWNVDEYQNRERGGGKAKTTIKISVNWFLLRCLFYFGEIFYSLAARADFFVNLRALVQPLRMRGKRESIKLTEFLHFCHASLCVVTCAYADILPLTNLPPSLFHSLAFSLSPHILVWIAIKKLLNYHRVEGWKIG